VNTSKDFSGIKSVVSNICQAVTRKGDDRTNAIVNAVTNTVSTVLGGSGGNEERKFEYRVFFRNGGFYRLDTVFYHYHAEGSSVMNGSQVHDCFAYRARSTLLNIQKADPQVLMALMDSDSLRQMEKQLLETNRFYVLLNYVMTNSTSMQLPRAEDGSLNVHRLMDEHRDLHEYIAVEGPGGGEEARKRAEEEAMASRARELAEDGAMAARGLVQPSNYRQRLRDPTHQMVQATHYRSNPVAAFQARTKMAHQAAPRKLVWDDYTPPEHVQEHTFLAKPRPERFSGSSRGGSVDVGSSPVDEEDQKDGAHGPTGTV